MTFRPDPKPTRKKKRIKDWFYQSTAWNWTRRYILSYYADDQGFVECCTCKKKMQLGDKNTHVGHYHKVIQSGGVTNMITAFDTRNMLPQCNRCNWKLGGRPEVMIDKLIEIFGVEEIHRLSQKTRGWKKWTDLELQEITEERKQKTYQLIKQKGLGKWWIK